MGNWRPKSSAGPPSGGYSRSYSAPSSSYGSGKSAGTEIGEALAPLVEALIFKGIPALFRKIGGLFTPKAKAATANISTAKTAPKTTPPPPIKKDPPILTGLTLEATPDRGAPGQVVTLTARLTLNDSQASKANIAVSFKARPETLVRFAGAPRTKTDASGTATTTVTLRRDHGVRQVKTGDTKAVQKKSTDAHDALDDEVRAMNADPSGAPQPEVEDEKDETIEFEVGATLGVSLAATALAVIAQDDAAGGYEIDTSALIAMTDNTAIEGVSRLHSLEPEAPQILLFLQANKGKVFVSPQALREYMNPVKRSTQEKTPQTAEEAAQKVALLAANQIRPTAGASEETVEKFRSARAAFRSPGDADILASAAEHKRILITTEEAQVRKYINAVDSGAPLPAMKFLQFLDNNPPQLRP